MTGDCYSHRAAELIKLCAKKVYVTTVCGMDEEVDH